MPTQRPSLALMLIVLALVGAGWLTGCGPSHKASETAANNADASVKRYPLTGRVVSVDKPNLSLIVDGDAIPGFMAPMQMPYQVKDASILDKVAAGNQIKAEIVVTNQGAYLENVTVRKSPPR
jgi:hypothetical protein